MNPVRPEELSALLDRELDREREREIRAQLAADPGLAAELEALRRLDRRARTAAATGAFELDVRMPVAQPSKRLFVRLVPVVVALLFVRVMSKVIDGAAVTLGMNAAALIVVLVAGYCSLRAMGQRDDSRVSGEGV